MSEIIIRNGFTKIPNFIFGIGLNSSQFMVLSILYEHMPNVNPSIARLAKICGFKIRHTTEILSQLEDKNLLGKFLQTGKRTRYFLHKDYNSFITKNFKRII